MMPPERPSPPDMGFVGWSDMLVFARRARIALPQYHVLVDIDDRYYDPEVAWHVVSLVEGAGSRACFSRFKRDRESVDITMASR
jgi:hypothetical protein